MALVSNVARKWNLVQNENHLSGRINDIFVNLTFVKHIRKNVNMQPRDYTKMAGVSLFEWVIQPKYENLTVNLYVSRKGEIDLPELSDFLDTHYESFRTSLPVYVNGYFETTLCQNDAINIKAWYVIDFLNLLTGFLSERGYFSGCHKCGSNDNLSQVYNAGKAKEICQTCCLKEAKF